MATIKRLGVAYDYGQVTVTLFGRQLVGIEGIEYDTKVEKKINKGRGNQNVSRSVGGPEHTGKLVGVDMKELRAILQAAGKQLHEITEFPVVVAIGDDTNNRTIVDTLYAEFTGMGVKTGVGADAIKQDLELSIMDIEYGV